MDSLKNKKWYRKPGYILGALALTGSAFAYVGSSSQPAPTPVTVPTVQAVTQPITQTVAAPIPVQKSIPSSDLSNNNYYTNVDGNQVHSPAYSESVPAGASAQCRDGTYSFSQHRQGTCSHHGGVAKWL